MANEAAPYSMVFFICNHNTKGALMALFWITFISID